MEHRRWRHARHRGVGRCRVTNRNDAYPADALSRAQVVATGAAQADDAEVYHEARVFQLPGLMPAEGEEITLRFRPEISSEGSVGQTFLSASDVGTPTSETAQ